MSDTVPAQGTDSRCPKLLSLASHELRSPLSVVAGYVRMLLQQRAGPISADQRRLLEEAEKSCGRLSALLAELSDLGKLESGTAAFNRSPVNLRSVLEEAIASLPPLPERDSSVHIDEGPTASVPGDAVRLKAAFVAVFHALSRELVTAPRLAVRLNLFHETVPPLARIGIAEPAKLHALMEAALDSLVPFDEWRGGTGLTLPSARRIIEAHGGSLLAPSADNRASALLILPTIA